MSSVRIGTSLPAPTYPPETIMIRSPELGEVVFIFQIYNWGLAEKVKKILYDEVYSTECEECMLDALHLEDHLCEEELKYITIWSRRDELLASY